MIMAEETNEVSKISKVSEIDEIILANYLRISEPTEDDLMQLRTFLNVSQEYIKSYTNQQDLDQYPAFVAVVFVIVQDLYDNRALYISGSGGSTSANKVIENILEMYRINLL